tara:strand:+ start:480 stop:770 length:291 start_codon:yes stop_codon:yes gene_type:complete
MSAISVARARLAVLGRHIQTMAISENILFPTAKVCVEIRETMVSGYTIQMDVRHDEKIIDFVTEAMCPDEKRTIYLPQKRMMREMYPEYMIIEKHT